MRYGYFDDENREYVITTPRTPLPWINYLGSEDFFSLVSNTAGGYSFYRDAKLLRLTRYRYNSAPADGEGHRFYIRDGACVWNPGWQPVRTELDSYRCRHGLGYTVIEGAKNGIEAKQEMFVPLGDACEVIRLTLHNAGAEPRALQLFSYVEFCLWNAVDDSTNFQRNYSTGEVEVEGGAIYHKTEYRERREPDARRFRHEPGCVSGAVPRPGRAAGGGTGHVYGQHRPRLGACGRASAERDAGPGRTPQLYFCIGIC